MNFLELLREQITDIRNCAGMRRKIAVDAEALFMLMEDYERIYSTLRSVHCQEEAPQPKVRLGAAVVEVYRDLNREAWPVVSFVVDVLRPLEEQAAKEARVKQFIFR